MGGKQGRMCVREMLTRARRQQRSWHEFGKGPDLIRTKKKIRNQRVINLRGYMVGNGVTDPVFDGNALVPFAAGESTRGVRARD